MGTDDTIGALRPRFAELARGLREAADRVDFGERPDEGLMLLITGARSAFAAAVEEVQSQARAASIELATVPTSLAELERIEGEVRAVTERRHALRARYADELARVLRLEGQDGLSVEGLAELKKQAQVLLGSPELAEEALTPFRALLMLVEGNSDSNTWFHDLSLVAGRWGNGLAAAAGSRRLTFALAPTVEAQAAAIKTDERPVESAKALPSASQAQQAVPRARSSGVVPDAVAVTPTVRPPPSLTLSRGPGMGRTVLSSVPVLGSTPLIGASAAHQPSPLVTPAPSPQPHTPLPTPAEPAAVPLDPMAEQEQAEVADKPARLDRPSPKPEVTKDKEASVAVRDGGVKADLPLESQRRTRNSSVPPQRTPQDAALDAKVSGAVWQLLDSGEDSLALLLLRVAEREGRKITSCPSANTIEVGILAVRGGDRTDWARRFEHLELELSAEEQPRSPAAVLFTTATLALRSVLPTGSVAAAAFQHLDVTGLPPGAVALRVAVEALVRGGLGLTHELMRGAKSQEMAEVRRAKARQELVNWWEQNKKAQLRFARATNVWRHWMRSEGLLGRELGAVLDGDTERVGPLLQMWDVKGDGWKSRVHSVDYALAGPRAKDDPIGDAVMRREFPQKLSDMLERCKALQEAAREAEVAPDPRAMEALNRLRGAVQQASTEVRDWSGKGTHVKALSRRLHDLQNLLNGASPGAPNSALPEHLTFGGWLRVPGLQLGSSWALTACPLLAELCDVTMHCAQHGDERLAEAAQRAEAQSNYRTFRRLLEHAEALGKSVRGLDSTTAAAVRARAEQHRDHLARDSERALTRALFEALLPEKDIVDYRAEVESVRRAADDDLELDELRARLSLVGKSIEARRSERKAELGQRLGGATIPVEARRRIEGALQRDDLQVAEELMAAAERGESLDTIEERRSAFQEFFPDACKRLNDWFEQSQDGWRPIIEALEQPAPATVAVLNLSRVDDNERRRSAKEVANQWRAAKRMTGDVDNIHRLTRVVSAILMGLDFKVRNVKGLEGGNDTTSAWLLAETEPLRNLPRFVLPAFGSRAAGRYRILCTWDRPDADRLLHRVATRQEDSSSATIVFFFGRLSEQRRREVARLSRGQRKTFLVLDDLLLAFLLAEREMRLLTLLAAATPFTTASPYVTTAGRVDPEMFFGRQRERERLWDTRGAHLLYGGRQLGKTALLRAIERDHHAPDRGVVVKWIDLKEEGIGHARAAEDIWSTIAACLRDFGIVKGSPGADTLRRQVEEWLQRDRQRRILLLLDEADAFLKADAATASRPDQEGFDHVSRLTAIMNSTNGQFKVVFAGLHNVQRTARNVNSKLAHLGEPICIGPLFGGDAGSAEAKAALALVCEPLEALGLLFESPDLPLRVLAHTNWYPSLTQLFCRELYEHILASRQLQDKAAQIPPYAIRSRDIDDAYRTQGLRDGILERFRITLDLDRRYRVIALCIAAQSVRDRVRGIREGFSLEWIRGQCLYWWERGFSESRSHESIRSLLDEMVGLGVLRLVQRDHYAMRNPNVLNLLGNQEEIDRDLEDAITQEPAAEYEPGTFRRAKADTTWVRNPLSAAQESELLARTNGIRVLVGLRSSGLDELQGFLERPVGGAVSRVIERPSTAAEFEAELQRYARERDAETLLIVVPHLVPWTKGWIDSAADALRKLRLRTKPVRVVFVADGHRVWQEGPSSPSSTTDFGVLTLTPWAPPAVKRLLSDLHVPEAEWSALMQQTGGWAWYIHRVASELMKQPRQSIMSLCTTHRSAWLSTVRGELPEAAVPVLQKMAEWAGPITVEELRALLEGEHDIERVLEWGGLVGLLDRTSPSTIVLEPTIAEAIIASTSGR